MHDVIEKGQIGVAHVMKSKRIYTRWKFTKIEFCLN